MQEKISKSLKSSYDEFYSDSSSTWRELGGKYKAENILAVCKNYNFGKVLDCGAGEGSVLKFLEYSPIQSDLYAIEISDTGISQIKKRNLQKLIEVKKFDGYVIPYPDKYFNMAYCSHVIEHVEHPRILLRELKRTSEFQVFEIPLDYSINVDKRVDHYLSYGHINIFTPSTFRFLLKSEGYKIIEERLTKTPNVVTRFNWYNNMKLKTSYLREAKLAMRPVKSFLKRIILGKNNYSEFSFNAYTCLTKGTGELEIFKSPKSDS